MYSSIKGLILKIIPKQFIFHYEYSLRYFYFLFYTGSKFQCNICEKKLSNFVLLENDRLCPRCGSIQRTRRLWETLNDGLFTVESKILDFSPSRSIYRLMKKNPNYLSTDLSGDFLSKVAFDITNIDTKNESFDLIICYHILEHIDNDHKAMEELFRILRKGGNCVIQTPFKNGEIYEDETITSPKQREIHFGQFDHVRIYSEEGLKRRLENVGFIVNLKHFTSNYENLHGFNKVETVLICNKPN
jgi:SAM-dependent methyltransferase